MSYLLGCGDPNKVGKTEWTMGDHETNMGKSRRKADSRAFGRLPTVMLLTLELRVQRWDACIAADVADLLK